jgi:hypothetical protein
MCLVGLFYLIKNMCGSKDQEQGNGQDLGPRPVQLNDQIPNPSRNGGPVTYPSANQETKNMSN